MYCIKQQETDESMNRQYKVTPSARRSAKKQLGSRFRVFAFECRTLAGGQHPIAQETKYKYKGQIYVLRTKSSVPAPVHIFPIEYQVIISPRPSNRADEARSTLRLEGRKPINQVLQSGVTAYLSNA